MAFKIKPFYSLNQTPIYRTLDEDGILGVANKNGTIRIHKNVTNPAQLQEVIDHEMVHRDQMNPESNDTGRFGYDNNNMYYKPKGSSNTIVTKRGPIEGADHLKHEIEANDKKTQLKIKRKYEQGK